MYNFKTVPKSILKKNNKLASSLIPHASLLFDNDIQNEWNGMH